MKANFNKKCKKRQSCQNLLDKPLDIMAFMFESRMQNQGNRIYFNTSSI